MKNIDNPRFARAVALFLLEHRMSYRHSRFLFKALELYGDDGNPYARLSGGHYAHWPDMVKRRSRRMVRAINRLCDAGMKSRPRGVRLSTMRNLRRDVQFRHIVVTYGVIA